MLHSIPCCVFPDFLLNLQTYATKKKWNLYFWHTISSRFHFVTHPCISMCGHIACHCQWYVAARVCGGGFMCKCVWVCVLCIRAISIYIELKSHTINLPCPVTGFLNIICAWGKQIYWKHALLSLFDISYELFGFLSRMFFFLFQRTLDYSRVKE